MNTLDTQYQNLLKDILETGIVKKDRTGTGTTSIFGTHLKHNMKEGFPLLTTKKVYWKGIVHELIWFLKGDTNIKYLVDNGVNIWNGDAYKKYITASRKELEEFKKKNPDALVDYFEYTLENFIERIKNDTEFADKWGELGPIYGKQWRSWKTKKEECYHNDETYPSGEYKWKTRYKGIDQISILIEKLKTNPDDRRMIVSAWNVAELSEMTLPPCHYAFEVWTRELSLEERNYYYTTKYKGIVKDNHEKLNEINIPKRAISLKFNMRSIDTMLGLPFNIASYGLLLSIIGKVVNMVPENLVFSGGDTHLYLNHLEQAKEQIQRTSFELPTIKFKKDNYNSIDEITADDIILSDYNSHDAIKAQLSN